jgi:arylsulfatase A-like enzyme
MQVSVAKCVIVHGCLLQWICSLIGLKMSAIRSQEGSSMTQRLQLIFPLLLMIASTLACADARQPDQPNIIVILADDLGYSDVGAYGGEIRTPNIDSLAAQGIQLTNYHTGPTCGPTRAMLMSGVDHHRAGVGINAAALMRLPEIRGRPGYEGYLNHQVVTFASLLKDAGYHTYMTGKWDLGKKPGQLPTDRGFEHYFGIADGGASHFADGTGNMRPVAKAAYFEDDRRLETLPDDFYSSRTYTDRLLGFIEARPGDDEPYFAYLAYTAPHWPLHVPDDWIDKYQGEYDEGWHVVRQARFERQKELGLLPPSAGLPEESRGVDDWEKISPSQKQVELKRIELHAAMIELMDLHIGRLLSAVDNLSDRETIIIFMSDNGAEGNAIGELLDNEYWIPATFDNRLDNMGKGSSYVYLGAGWGQATVAPFRIYKSYTTEGGIRAPAVIYSTGDRFAAGRKNSLVTVMDIAPTILEIAGVEHPGTSYGDRKLLPMTGISALPLLSGKAESVHGESSVGWELYGNRALFKGDWKAVLIWPPEGNGEWQLFNIKDDPTEFHDLASTEVERANTMIHEWNEYAAQNGVAIFDEDIGYGRYR